MAIQHLTPTAEFIGLTGSPAAARRLGRVLIRSEGVENPARPTVVCVEDGEVLGFLQYSVGDQAGDGYGLGVAAKVVAALGWRAMLLPRRLAARRAVELTPPPDSFYIAELHVHPDHRGQGIGGRLLHWSKEKADSLGANQLSLVTGASNPAIRLYERHGFVVVRSSQHARYERYFGMSGRVLMTAQLEGPR